MGFRLLILLLSSLPLLAHSGGFASVDTVMSNIKPRDVSGSADVYAIQFKFGTALNEAGTLAGEFRAGLGLGSDNHRGERYEMDRYFGTYLRAQFPSHMPVRPYGMVGVTRLETTRGTRSNNLNDMSLGLGVEMELDHKMFVSLEYLRAADRSKGEVSNIGLGVGARF